MAKKAKKMDSAKKQLLLDTAQELMTIREALKTKTKDKKMEFNTEKDAYEWAEAQGKKIKNLGNTSNGIMFEVEDAFKEGVDFGGDPTKVEGFEGMSYKEVLERALDAENEAIFLGLYAVQLASDKDDIKELVEVTNDENHHVEVYRKILDRLEGSKRDV